MAKKSKEIDNLTLDVLAAEKAGMSYGQYKAMTRESKEKAAEFTKTVFEQLPVEEEYDWYDICVVCGARFRKRTWNQKTCSEQCRITWNKDYARNYQRNKPVIIHHE